LWSILTGEGGFVVRLQPAARLLVPGTVVFATPPPVESICRLEVWTTPPVPGLDAQAPPLTCKVTTAIP
jgi:hypothetical protein